VIGLGARVTPILERRHARSFYFREPSGVLFEIATREPGVTLDAAQSRTWPTTEIPLPAAA
jgi:glyoxalase family protein